MAVPTNAYQRVDVTNEIPDIRDLIYIVDPDETPKLTNFNSVSVDNTTAIWHEDGYDALDDTNAHIDGDEFLSGAITSPLQLSNHCQISRKDLTLTRRAEGLSKVKPSSEELRQIFQKGVALKRDINAIISAKQIKVEDTDGNTIPKLAGLPSWIAGIADGAVDRDAGGTDPIGDGTDLPGDAPTTRRQSEQEYLDIFASIFNRSGEMPDSVYIEPNAKNKFSAYVFGSAFRGATQIQDQGDKPNPKGITAIGAVDQWVTDFGTFNIIPDWTQRPRDIFVVKNSLIDVAFFDEMHVASIAKRSDTKEHMILADYTIVPQYRKSMGMYADIDESAYMVA